MTEPRSADHCSSVSSVGLPSAHPAAALVVAHETEVRREELEPVLPHRAAPFVFEMRQPVRRLDERRSVSRLRPRQLRAVRRLHVADLLAQVLGFGLGRHRDIRLSAGAAILAQPGQSSHGARAVRARIVRTRQRSSPVLKRLLFFAYAVTSYLIFLATFLYAIAFVGGFLVPRRLDGPLEGSLPAALAIDCALLTVFAVQHSVMARRWFKERWTRIVPWAIERSTYVLCASLALLLLFWQWRPLGMPIWTIENDAVALRIVGAVRRRLEHGADRHLPHQSFRSVRPATGLAAAAGPPLQARVVPHAAPLPARAASAVLRLPARVLDDADDDARTPGVRGSDDRVHRARDPVRRTRSRGRARRGLRRVSTEGSHAVAGTACHAGDRHEDECNYMLRARRAGCIERHAARR